MAFQYKKAVRKDTHLLIGLAGGTGSGKTYSAMLLATGICNGGPFLMIDTEASRGLHYADQFDFEHQSLGPPFTPAKYVEAVRAGAKRGFPCIVVDSASHEWEGEGGVLEMADADPAKSPGNWIKPKAAHNRMVNAFLQANCSLIFCLRAQEKLDLSEKDGRGKVLIKSAGWQPICEKRFPFEMTASFTFNQLTPGVVDLGLPHKLQDQHRMAFPPGQHLSLEAGKLIGQWARGDAIEVPDQELWTGARRAANEGMEALKAFSLQLPAPERAKLKPIREELVATGKRTDHNLAAGVVGENVAKQASEPTAKPDPEASQAAGVCISENAALDLAALLDERGIKLSSFLERIGVTALAEIRVAAYPGVLGTIEKWAS